MLLIATPGASTANSYVTVDVASAFLQERLHTDPWFGPMLTEAQALAELALARVASLIWATRLLDEQVDWHGTPLTATQPLAWPMTGQVDPYGRTVSSITIPVVIQRATAFYALTLLRDVSEDSTAAGGAAEVASLKLGNTTVVYRDRRRLSLPPHQRLSQEIRSMLRPYGRITGGVMVPLLRT